MADGSLTVKLTEETSALIKAAAEEAGESTDAFANRLLAGALETDRWAIAHARMDEYDRTGIAYDAGPVLEQFKANVRAKMAAKLAAKG